MIDPRRLRVVARPATVVLEPAAPARFAALPDAASGLCLGRELSLVPQRTTNREGATA